MKPVPHILVIDDDPFMCDSCAEVLSGEGYRVTSTTSAEEGLRIASSESVAMAVLDMKMPKVTGIEVLERIQRDDPSVVVIVITAFGTVESAVEAMRAGAHDYLLKPFSPDELRLAVKRGLDVRNLTIQNAFLKEEIQRNAARALASKTMLGSSDAMGGVRKLIEKVGPTDSTVLLLGETGTGKEVAARMIHDLSLRRGEPMLTVDCGSLAETLFESELFGHVKGAYTGAYESKMGRFELASGGTIFFDEIGNISTMIQAKLLRAIQEREITRVGGTQVINVDVRIIAATNMDLAAAVGEGTFREDLFYRLSVFPVQLPPLRERRQDIPELATFFLDREVSRRKKHVKGISRGAMDAMMAYDWPGNIRELETLIERAVVLCENTFLRPTDLMFFGRLPDHGKGDRRSKPRTLSEMEAAHISEVLRSTNWHMMRTSDILGIDRKTLRRKISLYNLKKAPVVQG